MSPKLNPGSLVLNSIVVALLRLPICIYPADASIPQPDILWAPAVFNMAIAVKTRELKLIFNNDTRYNSPLPLSEMHGMAPATTNIIRFSKVKTKR